MGWLISTNFLLSSLAICFCLILVMCLVDEGSGWNKSKLYKATYLSILAFTGVFYVTLSVNMRTETTYGSDWVQVYQNDKQVDLDLSLDREGELKIPLNSPLANTKGFSKGYDPKNYTHFITLRKDNMSITRRTRLVDLVGELNSKSKIVKVEYRKIDYTQNKLFGLVGSKETSDYDGELCITLDGGIPEGSSQTDLVNWLNDFLLGDN